MFPSHDNESLYADVYIKIRIHHTHVTLLSQKLFIQGFSIHFANYQIPNSVAMQRIVAGSKCQEHQQDTSDCNHLAWGFL